MAKALSIQKNIVSLHIKVGEGVHLGNSNMLWSQRSLRQELEKGDTTMATAIKAIPTLKGKEAREFLRRAEEAERDFKGNKNKDQHPLCLMAHEILSKAGML